MRKLVYVFSNLVTGEKKLVSDYEERGRILEEIKSGNEKKLSYDGIDLVEVLSIDEVVNNAD